MGVFKKRPIPGHDSKSSTRVEWDLRLLVDRVREAAPGMETREVEGALVQARLADHYRDIDLAPPEPDEFVGWSSDLDAEGWRRLALAVETLDDPQIRSALGAIEPRLPVPRQVEGGFLGLAREVAPLTVSLVRQSAVRAEEFARHLAERLGVAIAGETEAESHKRLYAIDYRRLLAEAEKARAAADPSLERLREIQAQADGRRRRGKW